MAEMRTGSEPPRLSQEMQHHVEISTGFIFLRELRLRKLLFCFLLVFSRITLRAAMHHAGEPSEVALPCPLLVISLYL